MIVSGTNNYTYSGRRRKVLTNKKVQPVFKAATKPLLVRAREDKQYPSVPLTKYTPPSDKSYRQEVSKQHTVAIAYNKGGYMVISKDNIRDIGK